MKHSDKEYVRQAFAQRLREALMEMGYSLNQQKEIGQLFGVSGQAARKWWEGQGLPASTRMKQIADVLGVERSWLQDGEGPMRPVLGKIKSSSLRYGEDMPLSYDEADLIRTYRSLTQPRKTIVRCVSELLLKEE